MVLAVSSFDLWRSAHRPGIGVVIVDRPSVAALFLATHLAAGVAVTALIVWYEWILRTHVSQTPVDILRFSVDAWDPIRLLVVVGLVALNAAMVGIAILLFRLAWSPWSFPGHRLGWRIRGLLAWLVPSAILFVPTADCRSGAAVAVGGGDPLCRRRGMGGEPLCAHDEAQFASHAIAGVVPRGGAAVARALPVPG